MKKLIEELTKYRSPKVLLKVGLLLGLIIISFYISIAILASANKNTKPNTVAIPVKRDVLTAITKQPMGDTKKVVTNPNLIWYIDINGNKIQVDKRMLVPYTINGKTFWVTPSDKSALLAKYGDPSASSGSLPSYNYPTYNYPKYDYGYTYQPPNTSQPSYSYPQKTESDCRNEYQDALQSLNAQASAGGWSSSSAYEANKQKIENQAENCLANL